MNISITSSQFAVLLSLSIAIAIWYLVGYRRNLRLIERVSRNIEEALRPSDKEYVWLGGVLGFTGSFEVVDFKKVTASVFMLPRQSVLYYPFSYITTGYDRLEVFFYLKKKVYNEIHIIRITAPCWMPKIYNADVLVSRKIELNEQPFILMYKDRTREVDKVLALGKILGLFNLMHIAVTPSKSIFYIRLKINPSELRKIQHALRECMVFLRGHYYKA